MAEFCNVWGKHRYPSRAGAEAHLRQLQGATKYTGKAYRCPDCGGWHVGRPSHFRKQVRSKVRGDSNHRKDA